MNPLPHIGGSDSASEGLHHCKSRLRELKLRDLADLVALSPRQFQRKFVNTFGVRAEQLTEEEVEKLRCDPPQKLRDETRFGTAPISGRAA